MISEATISRFENGRLLETRSDQLGVEEPLEIRVEGKPVAVVMRTPGNDRELAAGWLLSEGVIRGRDDLHDIILPPAGDGDKINTVDVMLKDAVAFQPEKFSRNVITSSSCGICGTVTLDAAMRDLPALVSDLRVSAALLHELPSRLSAHQPAFQRTGGLHACALFDSAGGLVAVREDVGRHNALDKLAGWALYENRLPLSGHILLLSGRVSFEMMQKAFVVGVPVVAAIGAPSSLAVELAARSGQTLVAFLKGETLNVYAGRERLMD